MSREYYEEDKTEYDEMSPFMKKLMWIMTITIIALIALIGTVNAVEFQNCYVMGNCKPISSGNSVTNIYNNNSANSSNYWQNMNSINSTQMENNGGALNILESWLKSLFYTKTEIDTETNGLVPYSRATSNLNFGSNNMSNITQIIVAQNNSVGYGKMTIESGLGYGNVYVGGQSGGVPLIEGFSTGGNSRLFKITSAGGVTNFASEASRDIIISVGSTGQSEAIRFKNNYIGMFMIPKNVTAFPTCNSTYEGAIYYDGGKHQHKGCNSTTWNALY